MPRSPWACSHCSTSCASLPNGGRDLCMLFLASRPPGQGALPPRKGYFLRAFSPLVRRLERPTVSPQGGSGESAAGTSQRSGSEARARSLGTVSQPFSWILAPTLLSPSEDEGKRPKFGTARCG